MEETEMITTLEECKEFVLCETMDFVNNEVRKYIPNLNVSVKFNDRHVHSMIAKCTRLNPKIYGENQFIITYYTIYLKLNLNNIAFLRETIIHECLHIIAFDNGHRAIFHELQRNYNLTEGRTAKIEHIRPTVKKSGNVTVECPTCHQKYTVKPKYQKWDSIPTVCSTCHNEHTFIKGRDY